MDQIALFISAVSDEFAEIPKSPLADGPGDYRAYLNRKLKSIGVHGEVQEDFISGPMQTLERMVAYIKSCDAVIHLVGEMTGATASATALQSLLDPKVMKLDPSLPPGVSTFDEAMALGLSYTQWEACLARQLGRPLLIFEKGEKADTASKFIRDPVQQARQREHLVRLKQHPISEKFLNKSELATEIWRNIVPLLAPEKRNRFLATAAFILRISRPHLIGIAERVVAVSLHQLDQGPKIISVVYVWRGKGIELGRIAGRDGSFVAHFERNQWDTCELSLEITLDPSTSFTSKPVIVSFARGKREQSFNLDRDGGVVQLENNTESLPDFEDSAS